MNIYGRAGIAGVVGEMHWKGDGAATVWEGGVSPSACCCARTLDDRRNLVEVNFGVPRCGLGAGDRECAGFWMCLSGDELEVVGGLVGGRVRRLKGGGTVPLGGIPWGSDTVVDDGRGHGRWVDELIGKSN
jgi:hypothetical protein